ncbi:unnamed protein product [Cladocopium goreaui]|uniref:Protein MEI2-like 4 (OML4) (MEI2-like protein 4) n=1 Tax=Cladocopium goreaui TaxID=2562237 RepID=A0A9P1CKR3_9DINO|nr:unnamed protein product [Cladocopium goreaui]|mmetsp:Transcript_39297/g.84620  ORF Transcript_39297/g.84620 Transcript_39297/m.84620 type:complete len:307 (-) Transcript_39297:103-1023(-)
MEDPHVDSWAALHLPAIEQLLLNLPDEEYRSTGVGDSEGSFFQSVVNTTPPPWPDEGLAQIPEELQEDLRCGPVKLDLYTLQSLGKSQKQQPLSQTQGDLTGYGDRYGPWLLGSPKEVGQLKNPSPPNANKVGGPEGAPQGRTNGPIGHKKVPKRINIQEEFGTDSCEITTAMIRNVPNQLNRKQFVERLDQLGFLGMYDFVYVPIDRATRMNVGYAFVNFVNSECFRLCQITLQGKKFLDKEEGDKRRSGKPIIVSAAHVQGLENNERHFKDAAVAHTLHRPVKFQAGDASGRRPRQSSASRPFN